MMKNRFFKTAGRWLILAATIFTAWQLLANSRIAIQGARQSLALCGNVLIPSLFPFMVLAAFLPATQAGRMAAGPIAPMGRVLYGLSAEASRALAPALLISWIGGYPAGARAISVLVEQKQISRENASLALCFCVNSGPAFIVTVVGAGIFGSVSIGFKLFACQLLAGAVTARIMHCGRGIIDLPRGAEALSNGKSTLSALVLAVASAAAGMLSVCAFVLVCGTLAALLGSLTEAGTVMRVVVDGCLEISMACGEAQRLSPMQALTVLPFLLSFSGASCIFQLLAIANEQDIPTGRFLLSRPIHGLFTGLFAYCLLREECAVRRASLITSPALVHDYKSPIGTLLLLAMCAMLFLTLETDI